MNKLLFKKIQHRLKEKEIKYTTSDSVIQLNMNIGGVVGKLSMIIDVLDKSYVTYAVLSNNVSKEHMSNVAEYLHRANFGLLYGNFELDYNDGEIRYKVSTDCEDANAITKKQIDRSILLPCIMFEKYGNGIIRLMLDIGNPEELIREAESPKANN